MSYPIVDWADEANISTLTDGLKSGLSYAQIAKRIHRCTRCAAIGKAKRLGLAAPREPSAPSLKSLPSMKPPPVARLAGRGTVFIEPPPRPPRAVVPFTDEPAGSRTILTIGFGECRWPIGDPEDLGFTLCGCKAERGAYCEPHARRAFTSEATRKWVDSKLAMPAKRRFT